MDKDRLIEVGIDYMDALKYFAFNEDMYNKYLMKFEKDNHMEMARKALSVKDYENVLKNVHVMKGMVSSLGMSDLFKACSDVVQSIRASQYDLAEKQFKDIEHEYDKVMQIYK